MTRPVTPILQGFFDDSGGDPKSPIYVLAGYVATQDNAGIFSRKWGEIMDGPPWLEYWHTNTARGGYGGKFELEHLVEREIALAQLIASTSRYLVYMSIEMNKALFARTVLAPGKLRPNADRLGLSPTVLSVLSHPFYVLFHYAMVSCWRTAQLMTGIEGTQIFMEDAEGAEWQDHVCFAARAYRRLSPAENRKAIASITFVPGKGRISMPGLEAADLWAWHIRRRATYPEEPASMWPARILLESCQGNRVVITEELLSQYVEDVNRSGRHAPAPPPGDSA